GDKFQQFYSFTNQLSRHQINDNLNSIEKDLNITRIKKIVCRENKRSNNSILSFINSFIDKNISIADDYKYELPEYGTVDDACKPEIRFFQHKREELEFVSDTLKT